MLLSQLYEQLFWATVQAYAGTLEIIVAPNGHNGREREKPAIIKRGRYVHI